MKGKKGFIHNKKGVIEMMETFMIIFVIFILMGIGMFFYFRASVSESKDVHREVCLTQTTELISAIAKLTDINCKDKHPCIDTAKLEAFALKSPAEKSAVLESTVCRKNITIEQIYPAPDEKGSCVGKQASPDFPKNCNTWQVFSVKASDVKGKAGEAIAIPITLYYPTKDEYGMGKMVITVYTN
ncbi:MAG: hypothetical protein PHO02_06660 [Candidatus Nanoarchaeia archaeon]|nr:hypothetical protein [Candidatus Nanoarchaeia archaeon]